MNDVNRPRSLGRHLRQRFLTGLVVLLPLFITLWLLTALFRLVDGTLTPWIARILMLTGVVGRFPPALDEYLTAGLGVMITILVIYLTGLLSTNLLGVQILTRFDRLMLRIPGVRAVYGGSKQLMEAFNPQGKRSFTEVVMVEYPRQGVFTLGFVTRRILPELMPGTDPMSAVFLPTTPNPTSGWIAILPQSVLKPVPLSVEEGLKLVVSGGIVAPERWETGAPADHESRRSGPT